MTRAGLAVLAAVEALAVPGSASAAPCWERILGDWSDGRVDRTYTIACYHAALENLPEDVRLYSSAPDDIRRALARAVRASPTRALESAAPAKKKTATSNSRKPSLEIVSAVVALLLGPAALLVVHRVRARDGDG
jgi:hypothetical protein